MAASLCVSGHAAKGRAQIDLDNWDADEAVIVTRVDLALVHKERTETFTLPCEIRVEPDCDEHIDVTDALKKLIVENGESQVRVTVKGNPDSRSGATMWSHAINDGPLGGGEADAIAPQNVFCRSCERASSA